MLDQPTFTDRSKGEWVGIAAPPRGQACEVHQLLMVMRVDFMPCFCTSE
jgi:hypothetical protein